MANCFPQNCVLTPPGGGVLLDGAAIAVNF